MERSWRRTGKYARNAKREWDLQRVITAGKHCLAIGDTARNAAKNLQICSIKIKIIDKKIHNHESFKSNNFKLMIHGRSGEKRGYLCYVEKFKRLHIKLNFYRTYFLSKHPG